MESKGIRPVRVVEIINPFKPDQRGAEILLAPRPGENVAECLLRAGMRAEDYAVRHNLQYVEAGEEVFHIVMPGDELVCAAAAGGGRMFAMIAVMVVAGVLTGGFGAAAQGILGSAIGLAGASATTLATIGSAIAIGGNMLISAFMGPSLGSPNAASTTYDPTGPKTLARPGTPVPKAYGTMGWSGNIISSFVDQAGKDEYLNVLVAFGFGAATNIASIFLNNKPISSYPDLSYQFRPGSNTQTPVSGFDKIVNVYPQQIEMLAAQGPIVVTGTGTNTTGLQIAVKFPGGLMRTDSSGNPKEVSFAYKIEVSPSGQNAWTAPIFPRTQTDVYTTDTNGFRHYPHWVVMPTDRNANSGIVYSTDSNADAHYPGEPWSETLGVKVYNIDNTNYTYNQLFQGEWQLTTDLNLDLFSVTDWWGGYRIVSNMTDQSFYDVVNVYGLAVGKWDVRITKYGAGPHNQPIPAGDGYLTDPHYTADGWLWDVQEIQFTDLAYPNIILLGIRALATSQLSGANINIRATITHDIGADTVLPADLAGFEHDNPAIVAYDIITNPLYGMASSNPGITVDVPAFVRWAQFCDEPVTNSQGATQRRFVFAGVFDVGGSNAWHCLQQVGQMSRAAVVQAGTSYSVWLDAPTDVTQVFTEANILKGSYSETFIALDDRATLIEATFADAERNWRTDLPVSVMTASTINSGLQPKTTRVSLLGCSNRDQAWQWAYFNLLSTETLLRTAKWECGIESVSCRVGSVVGIQQRAWCRGGRVQTGSTDTSLLIDNADLLAFTANAGWTVGVVHPVYTVGAATISATAPTGNGSYLFTFTGNLPAGRILRIGAGAGIEAAVLGVGQSGGANSNTMTVSGVQGYFGAGTVVTLYDYDRVELQAVTALAGETVSVAGFSQAPTPDAPWFYGQSGGTAPYKTFRVTAIKQSGDFSFEISGLEYNPSIYEDVTPQYGEIVSAPSVNATVSNVTLAEKLQYTKSPGKPPTQAAVSVGWDNGPNTVGADIYGQVDGGAWNHLDHVMGGGYSFIATTGDVWSIKVVGFDALGVASSYNDAPAQTITVQGMGVAPADVIGFTGNYQGQSLVLSWQQGIIGSGQSGPGTFIGNTPTAPGGMHLLTGGAQGSAATSYYEIRYNADPGNKDWNTGLLVATNITASTYTLSTFGQGIYLIKALSKFYVESINISSFSLTTSSSGLNGIGSIVPGQELVVNVQGLAYDSTTLLCNVSIACPAQTLQRADGSTYSVPQATLTWTNLAPSTTYYFYPYIVLADGSFHCGAGDPPTLPDTSPNAASAMTAALDPHYAASAVVVTTPSTSGTGGTSSGGGSGTCPDGREYVMTKERSQVRACTLSAGEHVMGYCFSTGKAVYRKILKVRREQAWTWYRVNGYRMSPLDPVYVGGEWRCPYEVGEFDGGDGERVMVEVDADEYDQHNYYLIERGEWLLIHNQRIPAC